VTDGETIPVTISLEKAVREIQKTDTVIYAIGLLSEESKKSAKRAKRALEEITKSLRRSRVLSGKCRDCEASANKWRTISETSTRWRISY